MVPGSNLLKRGVGNELLQSKSDNAWLRAGEPLQARLPSVAIVQNCVIHGHARIPRLTCPYGNTIGFCAISPVIGSFRTTVSRGSPCIGMPNACFRRCETQVEQALRVANRNVSIPRTPSCATPQLDESTAPPVSRPVAIGSCPMPARGTSVLCLAGTGVRV